MIRTNLGGLPAMLVMLLVAAPLRLASAQQAVTVSGHVTAGGGPLAGARVTITDIATPIERTTDVTGRYSFVIPSASVRGQTVTITAMMPGRRPQFGSRSAHIVLNGAPIIQDLDLPLANGAVAPVTTPAAPGATTPTVRATPSPERSDIDQVPARVDITSALAGRVPGLIVRTSPSPGGSSSGLFRGPRSTLLNPQPLYVLDGLMLDNTTYGSSAQRFGLGGFDYGNALADVDLSTIASWRFLSGPEAAARYGGRGANGVVVLTSKSGSDGGTFSISASQQVLNESIVRLPELQNQYGQGLDGKFEFFDGKGGGVNDAIDQNWGPALSNQAVAQASYHEAGRPDVRLWSAQRNNVNNYFETGRTLSTDAALESAWGTGSVRASFGNRDTRGSIPNDHLLRRDGAFHIALSPADQVSLGLNAFASETRNTNAPGVGYNQGNPVSQFTRLGRQVSTDSLRANLHDAAGNQISWNYAGQNNPFVATLVDSNHSRRYHTGGSVSATAPVASWLTATATGGVDYVRDGRLFSIASGWMGGFPFYAGTGSFTKGGWQGDEIADQRSNATLRFDATRGGAASPRWVVGAGLDFSGVQQRLHSVGVDSIANVPSAGAPDTATLPKAAKWSAGSHSVSAFANAGHSWTSGLGINAGVRATQWTLVPAHHSLGIYPSASVDLDLQRLMPSLQDAKSIRSFALQAGVWRDANDVTPFDIASSYAGRTPSGSIVPTGTGLLIADPNLEPESTTGFQLGANLALARAGLEFGAVVYHERTSGLILPVGNSTLGTLTATNAGALTNSGVQAHAAMGLGDGNSGLGWRAEVSALRNGNTVDELAGQASSIDLGPSQFGMAVQARVGQPLGVLVGTKVRRDPASGARLLTDGLPVADPSGPQILGSMQPKWQFGLTNTFQYRWISLYLRGDAHVGGEVFSATNLWGSYAGTLASTAFRPDSGLLLAGIDATTKAANTQHVSTQNYYHALGAIQEPWVYSASYAKLREARLSVTIPMGGDAFPVTGIRASVVGTNLLTWAKAPNMDPDAIFNPNSLGGVELGQLPFARSIGLQITLIP